MTVSQLFDEREAMARLVAILVGREGGEVTLSEDETAMFRSDEAAERLNVEVGPVLGSLDRVRVVVTVAS